MDRYECPRCKKWHLAKQTKTERDNSGCIVTPDLDREEFLQYRLAKKNPRNIGIGAPASRFNSSALVGAFALRRVHNDGNQQAFLGKTNLMVALFLDSEGKIVRERMKWIDNQVPERELALLTILMFCVEATNTAGEGPEFERLTDLIDAQMRKNPSEGFEYQGYRIFFGELADTEREGDLIVEVSR